MEDFDRRSFLKIGSIAAFRWITLGDVLEQRAAAQSKRGDDISVIHLFLTGGMSQMDTFDPKPNAKPEMRSKFKPIPTSVPGLHVTEHLPRSAKRAEWWDEDKPEHPRPQAQAIRQAGYDSRRTPDGANVRFRKLSTLPRYGRSSGE